MSIISGKKIVEEINAGAIRITPFDIKYVNPISVDLTLGNEVAVYANCVHGRIEDPISLTPSRYIIDPKHEQPISKTTIPETGFILKPGIGYLMHTHESVHTEKYVPIIDGKSSVGRLFIQIHSTAGLGDPGFDGQFTLEVMVTHPIRVYQGMRIGQVRFYCIDGEYDSYRVTGNYSSGDAIGPVASKLWKSFNG